VVEHELNEERRAGGVIIARGDFCPMEEAEGVVGRVPSEGHADERLELCGEEGDGGVDILSAGGLRAEDNLVNEAVDERRDDAILPVGDDHGVEHPAQEWAAGEVGGRRAGAETRAGGVDEVGGVANVRRPPVDAGEAFDDAVVSHAPLELERKDVGEDRGRERVVSRGGELEDGVDGVEGALEAQLGELDLIPAVVSEHLAELVVEEADIDLGLREAEGGRVREAQEGGGLRAETRVDGGEGEVVSPVFDDGRVRFR